MVRGTTTMEAEGAWEATVIGVRGAKEGTTGAALMGTGGAEAPAASSAPWRRERASASLALLSVLSTILEPRSEYKR